MRLSKHILRILSLFILFHSCKGVDKEIVTVAAAANMQFAIKEIVASFTSQTGIQCELVVSSSGILTAQIKEGAPFDVFISADMKYPNELHLSGLTSGAPAVYALGKLVMWTIYEDIEPAINNLANKEIKHIAVANPKTAPYGKAAIETLKNVGVLKQIEQKLVYGEGISQTNQFIISGSSELGFTSKSVVLSPEMAAVGKWKEVDSLLYSPIEQGVVVINGNRKRLNSSMKFHQFLFSNESREILRNFGYTIEN